jgi:hypothetical protein
MGDEEGTGGSELAAGVGDEATADNREATPWHGVRWQSTSLVSLESSLGARQEATQAVGESKPQQRHGMAAKVLKIDHRLKNPVRRVFE